MSFENDILRLMLLEKYLPECKPSKINAIPMHVTPNPLEIKSRNCASVRFGDRTYAARKFGDKIWMTDNLDLSLRSFGVIADDATRSEKGIKYYTWKNAMDIVSHLPGWHLPSVEEWVDLNRYYTCIGRDAFKSEFNLFSTGYIDDDGRVFGADRFACFWTSTKLGVNASGISFDLNDGQVTITDYPTRSVGRCIRLVKSD